jgi:acetylornithine deacetylase/succinyl-diaminopimelate desuccinylase-like protein
MKMGRSFLFMGAALVVIVYFLGCSSTENPGGDDNNNGKGDSTDPVYDDPFGIACADAILAIPEDAWHPEERVDPLKKEPVLAAARKCLSLYLQINTSNPMLEDEPGEVSAVWFFETVFKKLGLPGQRTPMARDENPKRQNFIGSWKGTTDEPSIILLNHTDVVRAPGEWTHPPFSGYDDGEYIWGRGALDMKGVGISQLVAMAVLLRAGVELQRDVHFVAVADEEVGGKGAEYITLKSIKENGEVEELDPLGLNPGVVLNEGGNAVKDSLAKGHNYYVIGAEEKGVLWTQIAHADPIELIKAIGRIGILKKIDNKGLSNDSLRESIKSACSLTEIVTDIEKAVNVQPMDVKIVMSCNSDVQGDIELALDPLGNIFEGLHKTVTAGDNGEIGIDLGLQHSGHGSASDTKNALDVAATALVSMGLIDEDEVKADGKITRVFFGYNLSKAMLEFVSELVRYYAGEKIASITDFITSKPAIVNMILKIGGHFLPTDSPFRTTCSWTGFQYPIESEARAKLDCRLNHTHADSRDFETAMMNYLEPNAGVVLRADREDCFDCKHQNFNKSVFGENSAFFETIRTALERLSPETIASPYLFPAASDNYFFRRAGVPSFGIWPVALTEEEVRNIHSMNERVPVEELFNGVRGYADMIYHLSEKPGAPLDDAEHRLSDSSISCREYGDKSWAQEATSILKCDANRSIFYCEVKDDAPRFIRAVSRINDVRLYNIYILKPEYVPSEDPPSENEVERVVYQAKVTEEDDSSVRILLNQGFEIDTGIADKRHFLLKCKTPTFQYLGEIFGKTQIKFYHE